MRKITVLINNAGSQASDIMSLLSDYKIETICLAAKENNRMQSLAKVFIKEEELDDLNEYVNYLIELCIKYEADVFIPFRRMTELINCRDRFEKEGIVFLAPKDNNIFETLNDKVKTYDYFAKEIPEIIPRYALIEELSKKNNSNPDVGIKEFIAGTNNEFVCIKNTQDIAASSFRKVALGKKVFDIEMLSSKYKNAITETDFFNLVHFYLEKTIKQPELMLMDYLPGNEVSCDCLKTEKENIVIPRIKLTAKSQLIKKDERLMYYCNKMLDMMDYDTPCNIQFRMERGCIPKLLEINTRMSGGIYLSSQATHINIPAIAVRQSLDIETTSFDMSEWGTTESITISKYHNFYGERGQW